MKRCGIILAAAMLMATPLMAQDFTEDQIKDLALQAIRENPQIVMEAVAILEAQEDARKADQSVALLSSRRDVLERDPNAPVLGNVDGDVTIVEFLTTIAHIANG